MQRIQEEKTKRKSHGYENNTFVKRCGKKAGRKEQPVLIYGFGPHNNVHGRVIIRRVGIKKQTALDKERKKMADK